MKVVDRRDIFANDDTEECLRFIETEGRVSIRPIPDNIIFPSDIKIIYTPGRYSRGLSFDFDLCEFEMQLCFSWDTLQKLFNVAKDRIKT